MPRCECDVDRWMQATESGREEDVYRVRAQKTLIKWRGAINTEGGARQYRSRDTHTRSYISANRRHIHICRQREKREAIHISNSQKCSSTRGQNVHKQSAESSWDQGFIGKGDIASLQYRSQTWTHQMIIIGDMPVCKPWITFEVRDIIKGAPNPISHHDDFLHWL